MNSEIKHSLTLPKYTRLCGTTSVDRLFERDAAAWCVSHPLRAVWRPSLPSVMFPGSLGHGTLRFLITVPKKKLRHAVDRVAMRRRVREAYRLCRQDYETLLPAGTHLDIAFIYTHSSCAEYKQVERAVHRILDKLVKPYRSVHAVSTPQVSQES